MSIGTNLLAAMVLIAQHDEDQRRMRYGTCANFNKTTKCGRDNVPGHIYCDECRVANDGYNRYNPPAH